MINTDRGIDMYNSVKEGSIVTFDKYYCKNRGSNICIYHVDSILEFIRESVIGRGK